MDDDDFICFLQPVHQRGALFEKIIVNRWDHVCIIVAMYLRHRHGCSTLDIFNYLNVSSSFHPIPPLGIYLIAFYGAFYLLSAINSTIEQILKLKLVCISAWMPFQMQ